MADSAQVHRRDISSSTGLAPNPPYGTLVLSASEQQMQRHIVDSPLSTKRKKQFTDDYLRSRQSIGATEKLFKWAEAFEVSPDRNEAASAGFNHLVPKGPFVEGSNWADLGGWDFAVAQEQFLLQRFNSRLVEAVQETGQVLGKLVSLNAGELVQVIGLLSAKLNKAGFNKNAAVIAAELPTELSIALQAKVTKPGWDLPDDLRTNWIIGLYGTLPIVYIRSAQPPSVYVFDVSAYATLVQYAPPLDLRVNEISEADALRLVQERPSTTVSELQTKAQLLLYQTYDFTIHDKRAVYAARIGEKA